MILNDNLVSNSMQSAIKRFLHEPVGIIKGLEITISKITYDSGGVATGHYRPEITFKISKGIISLPYLYKKDLFPDLPYDVYGSFLVEIPETEEYRFDLKGFTDYDNPNWQKEYSNLISGVIDLGIKIDINHDINYSGIVLDLMDINDPDMIKLGSFNYDLNVFPNPWGSLSIGDDDFENAISFSEAFDSFVEFDSFDRLNSGQAIDLVEVLPFWINTDSFRTISNIKNQSLSPGDYISFSTSGFDLNFYPVYQNSDISDRQYLLRIEGLTSDVYKIKVSITEDGILNTVNETVELIKDDGTKIYRALYLLNDYSGEFHFYLNNNGLSQMELKGISIFLNSHVMGDSNDRIYNFSDRKSNDEIVGKRIGSQQYNSSYKGDSIPDVYINYPFTYSNIFRSLDDYLAINDNDSGLLKYNNSWYSGVTPFIVNSGSNSFVITPLNLIGISNELKSEYGEIIKRHINKIVDSPSSSLYESADIVISDEENYINHSYLRKGFPLLVINTFLTDNIDESDEVDFALSNFDNDVVSSPFCESKHSWTTIDSCETHDYLMSILNGKSFRPVKLEDVTSTDYDVYYSFLYQVVSGSSEFSHYTIRLFPKLTDGNNPNPNSHILYDRGKVINEQTSILTRKANLSNEIQLLKVM